jgi:hypothetical protein
MSHRGVVRVSDLEPTRLEIFRRAVGQTATQKFSSTAGTRWHFAFRHIRVLLEASAARRHSQ